MWPLFSYIVFAFTEFRFVTILKTYKLKQRTVTGIYMTRQMNVSFTPSDINV